MSEPDSPMEFQDETLDIDHLIMEIEGRSPLWDKSSKSYSDRILKTRLWEEVCQNVIPKWEELTEDKKKKTGADLQKKWKNLKDSFSRELASQKKSVSGESGKKKRKYIYFDQLSFLIAINTPRDTSSNVKPMEECAKSDIQSDEENTQPKQDTRRSRHLRKKQTGAEVKKGNTDIDEELLNILREKKDKNFDEDVSFAEMLIPMLRKLGEDQKINRKWYALAALIIGAIAVGAVAYKKNS
ncbi:uncharacterized protein LOC134796978 [Cydia splendana]|uniref:uncharacterized protein LOC134796978 n=1 Tax=Cydia splendana TaxID=1100963 RepID=UPI00300C4698